MHLVLAHMHSDTNAQKEKETERQMNWLSCVFPTCQTAGSSSLHADGIRHWENTLIISPQNRNNSLQLCLTSFDSSKSLQRSWAYSHASSLRLQTHLNNQGFNCCIIPQSINRGFFGYLDEIKQIPQETNTVNLSLNQMSRSQISQEWE